MLSALEKEEKKASEIKKKKETNIQTNKNKQTNKQPPQKIWINHKKVSLEV